MSRLSTRLCENRYKPNSPGAQVKVKPTRIRSQVKSFALIGGGEFSAVKSGIQPANTAATSGGVTTNTSPATTAQPHTSPSNKSKKPSSTPSPNASAMMPCSMARCDYSMTPSTTRQNSKTARLRSLRGWKKP